MHLANIRRINLRWRLWLMSTLTKLLLWRNISCCLLWFWQLCRNSWLVSFLDNIWWQHSVWTFHPFHFFFVVQIWEKKILVWFSLSSFFREIVGIASVSFLQKSQCLDDSVADDLSRRSHSFSLWCIFQRDLRSIVLMNRHMNIFQLVATCDWNHLSLLKNDILVKFLDYKLIKNIFFSKKNKIKFY